jgi:hypothetical protein
MPDFAFACDTEEEMFDRMQEARSEVDDGEIECFEVEHPDGETEVVE